MEIKQYQQLASRTCPDLGDETKNTLHMLMGLSTEVGELTDIHKRNFAYKKDLDHVNQVEEVGDIMWYLANYCNIHGINLAEAMTKNIAKLQQRFPEKFSEKEAIDRDTDAERKILEG